MSNHKFLYVTCIKKVAQLCNTVITQTNPPQTTVLINEHLQHY